MPLYNYVAPPYVCEQVDPADLSNLAAIGIFTRVDGSIIWAVLNDEARQVEEGDWIVVTNDPNARLQHRVYSDAEFSERFTAVPP